MDEAVVEVNSPLIAKERPILPLWLLAFIILLPAIETYVAITRDFHKVITYPLFKGLSIIAPIIIWRMRQWDWKTFRQRIGLKKSKCLWGLLSGIGIFAFIFIGYYALIGKYLDPKPVQDHVSSLGFASPQIFLSVALFIMIANSAYEEFFWRGFVFDELRMRVKPSLVIIIGGLLFGIHHVFALYPLFPPGFTVLFTAGTMAGGAIWSWMRIKGFSILDCYISHIFADLAVFTLGWDLLVKAAG